MNVFGRDKNKNVKIEEINFFFSNMLQCVKPTINLKQKNEETQMKPLIRKYNTEFFTDI